MTDQSPVNESDEQQGQPRASAAAQDAPPALRLDPAHRGRDDRLPSRRELLAQLNALRGLAAAGVLKPAQVNATRGVLETMLKHLDGPAVSVPVNEHVMEALRRNPEMLNLLANLLTDEQFAAAKEYIDGEPET